LHIWFENVPLSRTLLTLLIIGEDNIK